MMGRKANVVSDGLWAEYFVISPSWKLDDIDFEAESQFSERVFTVGANAGSGSFWRDGPVDNFAVKYTGEFNLSEAGSYTFFLSSDDGAVLYIDGVKVVENDGVHGYSQVSSVHELSDGQHSIEVRYFERGGAARLSLDWADENGGDRREMHFYDPEAALADLGVGEGVLAEYYTLSHIESLSDFDFSGKPTYSEVISEIDKSVGGGSFWQSGPTDNFAVKYTGKIFVDSSDEYQFFISSDDGSALYIDGKLVLSNDGVHPESEVSGRYTLSAGVHTVELLYFEHGGQASVSLEWEGASTNGREVMQFDVKPSVALGYGLLAEYYATESVASLDEVNFDRNPDFIESVGTVEKDAGSGAFWSDGPVDNFAVRYSGHFVVKEHGDYTFYVSSNDGAALYVDGELVVSDDGVNDVSESSAVVTLTSSVHDIEVRYFEQDGDANIALQWAGPGTNGRESMRFDVFLDEVENPDVNLPGSSEGLLAEYFDVGLNTSLENIDFSSKPDAVETVHVVDKVMGGGALWESGPNNGFAARYSGKFVTDEGMYTFYLTSDDGSALYVDGERIVNNDGLHGAVEQSASVLLGAGSHDIEIRYFERDGNATIRLEWQGPSTEGRELMPFNGVPDGIEPASPVELSPPSPFKAEYFDVGLVESLSDIDFSATPDHVETVSTIDENFGGGRLWKNGPADGVAIRYSGEFFSLSGNYVFNLTSDDGSALYVDGVRVISHDGVHGASERSVQLQLDAGSHDIELLYFERAGGASVSLDWSGPGIDGRQPVPFTGSEASTSNFSLIEDADSVAIGVPYTDSEGDRLFITSVDQPQHGTVELTENGVMLYTPEKEYNGGDAFKYVAVDAHGDATQGTVNLSILPGHKQPQHVFNENIAPEIDASSQAIILRKVAEIPNDASGGAPRMNGVVAFNENLYVWTDGRVSGEGRIYQLTPDGSGGYHTKEWFDVGEAVHDNTGRNLNNSNSQHGGLRSFAFHPDFEENGKFYTSIMEDRPRDTENHVYLSNPHNPIGADSVVVEWTVDLSTGKVDESSYREVFRIGMPVFDHTIRAISFNKYAEPGDEDYGLLYVAHGDGSVQSATAGGGQNIDALGKILRVDPLQNGSDPYSVPSSNPFVGDDSMLDEVFAYGFRNPHTMSFNKAEDGSVHLINGGVGRDNFDEINIVVSGGNYGWSDREGPLTHLNGGGVVNGVDILPEDDAEYDFIYPGAFYGHDAPTGAGFTGQSLAGSFVVNNGSELDGQYIFGDFGNSGRFFALSFEDLLDADTRVEEGENIEDALSWAQIKEVQIYLDEDGDSDTLPIAFDRFNHAIGSGRGDFRFGEGLDGELLITNKQDGNVYAVVNSLPSENEFFQSTKFDEWSLRIDT